MAGAEGSTTPPLTPQLIEKLEEGEYKDSAAPGLFLRVNKKSRTFRWYARSVGRAITIGRWSKGPKPGHVTLQDARGWLDKLRDAHRAGTLDQVVKELETLHPRRRETRPTKDGLRVSALAEEFLQHLDATIRRPEEPRRFITVEVLPAIGSLYFSDVRTEDIVTMIRSVSDRGAHVSASHLLGITKQFFKWVEDTKPGLVAPRFPKGKNLGAWKPDRRERYLDKEEIGAFWKALSDCTRITPTVRDALRLLLLLGVRSGELRQATWDEFDLDAELWTIPVEHQKKPKGPWKVPLPPRAVEILRGMKPTSDALGSKYVLASWATNGKPLTDKALNHAMRRLYTGPDPALTFTGKRPVPHDLRRTLRFHARQTLKLPFDVCEKLLAHSLGQIPSTYDPGDLFDERSVALHKWEEAILRAADKAQPIGSVWLKQPRRPGPGPSPKGLTPEELEKHRQRILKKRNG